MIFQVFRTTTYEISGFSDQSWNSRFSRTTYDIPGSSGLNMKFQVFQDHYFWNVRFLGPNMKFQVFQEYPWNSRWPGLIMNFHVFPDKSWYSKFCRTRVSPVTVIECVATDWWHEQKTGVVSSARVRLFGVVALTRPVVSHLEPSRAAPFPALRRRADLHRLYLHDVPYLLDH